MLETTFTTTPISYSAPVSFIDKIRDSEHSRMVDLSYIEALKQPYKIRHCTYLRVSTLKQAESKKVSIPEQKASVQLMTKTHADWNEVSIYDEGGSSGKVMETRDEFERMTKDAMEGKFDVIVAWSTDRLARNFEEMTAYRKLMRSYGVQITTVMEPTPIVDPRTLSLNFKSQDKIMNAILDWKSEADNETRVARFNLGKLGKAKRGVNPCKVGYGYKKTIIYVDGDPNKKQEDDLVVENQAKIIREIYTIYDQKGWGFRNIANKLNEDGTPSPKGGLWSYSTIKYILQNPTYTGLVRWGWRLSESKRSRTRLQQGHEGIIVQGQHEPIVEPELFQRVQDKMLIRARLGGRAVASKGLLSGLIYCGTCNGHGHLSTAKAGKYREWSAYMCTNNAHHGKFACPVKYLISKRKAERAVIQKIKELASSPVAQDEFVKQSKHSQKKEIELEIRVTEANIERCKQDKIRVVNLLATQDFDELTITTLREKMANTDKEYLLNKNELAKLQNKLAGEIETENLSKETVLLLMDFDKIWDSSELDRRKVLLATIIKKVVVYADKKIYIEFNRQ